VYRHKPMRLSSHVVFVADRVQPRLGIPRALESLLDLLPPDQVELLLISGPPPATATYHVRALDQPAGWRGRLLAMRQLRRIATEKSQSGAVIVATGSWAFVALATATVFSRFKLTLWEHTMLPWRLRNEWRVSVVAAAVRLLSFRLERVVCVSESNRAAVARVVWPQTNLTVIPNIADLTASDESGSLVAAGRQEGTKLVGIGSLTRGKNWALAVRAMEHLPENYTLELAGDGNQFERLSMLIDDLGLAGRVCLLGYVPDAQRLMDGADIVVHPSFAETFGYTMVEAAARQRPIVVVDMPVMNEMVPHFACGERAKPTPKEFAEAIMRAWVTDYPYSDTAVTRQSAFNSDSILMSWSNVIASLPR
jgi:hypothetical protein